VARPISRPFLSVVLGIAVLDPYTHFDTVVLNPNAAIYMSFAKSLIDYFAALRGGKIVLWCYLIWYLVTLSYHFEASPGIWLNSLGISAVIGFALLLSITDPDGGPLDRWQTFRLFLMPFCVSSFSSLIKGHGYFLVFPPVRSELFASLAACTAFVLSALALKRLVREHQT
jgi:hypothetical protein